MDDSSSTTENTAVAVDVLFNDWDPDGDPLTVTSVSQGSKGTVSFSPSGLVTYTPNPKAKGRDAFSYEITDGMNMATASVAVMIKKAGGGNNGKGKGNNK